jgi:uncharacterized protein (DUF1697 family)
MNARCYIALLRGVNVGRAKRVAMADLRKLMSDMGFTRVRTLLNSGNVVFMAPQVPHRQIKRTIEDALVMRLGVASRVTVIDSDMLQKIVVQNPLADRVDEPASVLALFLTRPRDRAAVEPLLAQDWGREALALGDHAVYIWCPENVLECRAAAAVGTRLGDATTSRNWNTVLKLHSLCHEIATSAD